MTQEEFKEMMDKLTAAEIERLGVDSEEFKQRDQEIMSMIADARKYQEGKKGANGETSTWG